MKVFHIIAVKDELTGSYLEPRFFSKKEEALRIFEYQINNIALWKDNPSDYSLFDLGTFDEETGTVIGIEPVKIAGGRSLLRKEQTNDIQPVE